MPELPDLIVYTEALRAEWSASRPRPPSTIFARRSRETITRSNARSRTTTSRGSTFRDEMAMHGRFRKPCPVCNTPVQRIRYAENECNYCATCQTGGRLLADRSLSRLLKDDWPKSVDEL